MLAHWPEHSSGNFSFLRKWPSKYQGDTQVGDTTTSSQDDDADWPRSILFEEYLSQNGTLNTTLETLYDVPTGMIVLLSFLYGSISVLAVVGNLLVMWVVATSRRMQSVTNCYIANLALADIVIGLFAVPFQFQAALLQRWLLPHFMCPFCPFVQALNVNVSVFTLTAIAIDRHRAIITPLSAHTSKRVAKVIIVLIWMLAFLLAAPMAMSWEVTMVPELDPVTKLLYKKPFCAPSEFGLHSLAIYRLILYICQYIIPLCVITFAYAHMSLKLWGARAPGNALEIRDANHMKNKKKLTLEGSGIRGTVLPVADRRKLGAQLYDSHVREAALPPSEKSWNSSTVPVGDWTGGPGGLFQGGSGVPAVSK
ncbi:neuropeptide Y receptor type 2-like [Cydia amplana]|uniref:neuropeptide Y receptor type 2-like n=1 Tax=Cydia amplana TaxID=1869771 RepID=UPI002FE57146